MDLRFTRLMQRVTQLRLQQLTGIAQCRISAIENDYICPRPDEKEILAAALGKKPNEIDWPKSVIPDAGGEQ